MSSSCIEVIPVATPKMTDEIPDFPGQLSIILGPGKGTGYRTQFPLEELHPAETAKRLGLTGQDAAECIRHLKMLQALQLLEIEATVF